jgi:hypothetical protein
MYVIIDTSHGYFDTALPAPPAQYPQIVASATTDLTNAYPLPATYQTPQSLYTDRMPAQPGIDDIQFTHIPFDIHKGNIIPV